VSDQIKFTKQLEPGKVPILSLEGRLDASGAQRLRELASEIRNEGHANLIVNLAKVEFVASSGFGTFLLLTEEFKENGGRIIFAASSPAVLEVVSLLNLDQFLNIEDSVESALAFVEA
jgi:anti-sigma B factor antagonist